MVLGSLVFYTSFAYDLDRADFIKLASLFGALFFLHYKLIQFEKWNFKFLLVTGILFRLVFLLTMPNLSQDFYRFIWDGELVSHGINPYLYLPNALIGQENLVISNASELFVGMGDLSARHYSNYPPLNQFLFAISSLLGGKSVLGSVIVMRLMIILADVGILYFGRKLLQNLNRSTHLAFWYFLSPLVIIELTGNLHFEGVMLFFFVWAMYLLSVKKWLWAAPVLACSILLKLVPLLFLPLFLNYLGFKKSILFYLTISATILLSLLPFYSPEFISNYSETIGLWFSNFEFNASLYNVAKKIAVYFDAKPWEFIKDVGKISPYITICIVLLFTFLRKNKTLSSLIAAMLWVLAIYYFISTTVHPWYPIFLVLLSIFTNYKFPLLWSLTIILSYWAYSNPDYTEHLGLLFIEYSLVFGYMIYEILKNKSNNVIFLKN